MHYIFCIFCILVDSTIANKNHTQIIATWLKEVSAFGKYTLCWKGTANNWNNSIFHEKCDGKRHTLSIFSCNNKVFGGYADIAWSGEFAI